MTVSTDYELGQAAALRGSHRILGIDPDGTLYPGWYRGFDSVPSDLRGQAPITGPVPNELMDRLRKADLPI